MSFKATCPNCSQKFEATDEHDGVEMDCPNCTTPFTIKKPLPVAFDDLPFLTREMVREKIESKFLISSQMAGTHKTIPTKLKNSTKLPFYTNKNLNPKILIRDVILMWGVAVLSSLFAVLFNMGAPISVKLVTAGIVNIILVSGGFFVCTLLFKGNPWKHLRFVAIGAWALGFFILFIGGTFNLWVATLPIFFICMWIGGGLGTLLKKMS